MTFLGWRTVQEGERVAIWKKNGTCQIVNGPKRVRLWRSRMERLQRHYANQNQYILIDRREGPREILPGPCFVFYDPVEHSKVTVKDSEFVDASEVMVVYRQTSEP